MDSSCPTISKALDLEYLGHPPSASPGLEIVSPMKQGALSAGQTSANCTEVDMISTPTLKLEENEVKLNGRRKRDRSVNKKQTVLPISKELPPRRRRSRVNRFCEEDFENYEMAMIQQAQENSRVSQFHAAIGFDTIPEAPTFHPTIEEFKDPMAYIESIKSSGEKYGILKIAPPQGWSPPPLSIDDSKMFPTKAQAIHTLHQGEDYGNGKDYTFKEFKTMADKFASDWSAAYYGIKSDCSKSNQELSLAEVMKLEDAYWRMVDVGEPHANVEYGNDLDVNMFWSGFPSPAENHVEEINSWAQEPVDLSDPNYYSKCGWNLQNLPFWPGSVLRWFRHKITGVNVPWLYLGMQFSTFAWHNEDNYMYSINYNHQGAPKIWYGIPGSQDRKFETSVKGHLRKTMEDDPHLLYNITTMVSPALLRERKISVVRICQRPGEFVVTFPKSYHGGFSTGFNIGEAVNFATPDWIRYGRESNERYRIVARPSVFSYDRMAFMLAMYLPDYSLESCKTILVEIRKLRDEELASRKYVTDKGVIDPGSCIKLQKFKLSVFDEKGSQHDDRRMCCVCKHTCFMSAVVCQCSRTRVTCLRHYANICDPLIPSGSAHKQYFLNWLSIDDLNSMITVTEKFIKGLENGEPMSESDLTRFWNRFDRV